MSEMENYILSALFFVLLCGLFYSIKLFRKKKQASAREGFIVKTLDLARSQFEIFDIKLDDAGPSRSGISALLTSLEGAKLEMSVQDYVPAEMQGQPIEVFFRTRTPDGPVFYTFSSKILHISPDHENSRLLCAMPQHLRVEKKRHFMRVPPPKNDIRAIGVWPMLPGQTLPSATGEIGAPLTHYRPGMTEEPVQIENISAAGLALRFPFGKDGKPAVEMEKGAQLLCLVIYGHEKTVQPVAFWCTGEIMNARIDEGQHGALVLGLEFTNWAVLEKGASEIHWSHSSPTRGVKPIAQWVGQIEAENQSRESTGGQVGSGSARA